MKASIKVSKAMWNAAEAVVSMGKEMGITITISDVYTKESGTSLALIAKFLIEQVKTAGKVESEIINDAV